MSQPEPVLMPLRTGVARMVLGTEAGAGAPATTLLPVGLTFHEPGTFRSGWALVLVGEPVRVDDCRALATTEPERAVRELTGRVADALRALIVEAEDRETLRLTLGLEAIRRAEAEDAAGSAAGAPRTSRPTARMDRVAWVQAAARADRWLTPRAPPRSPGSAAEVERYLADLERLGLSPRVVGARIRPAWRVATRRGKAWRSSAASRSPPGAWPATRCPTAHRARRPLRWRRPADVTATVKLVAGAVLYPVCWALEAWVVWRWLGGWGLAVFVAG